MVKDINSGPTGGKPLGLINFNGLLVFSASQSSSSMEIWSSNGTASGTTIAKTLENNADLVLFNGGVYFTGYRTLNRTNGTDMGTYIVRNFDPCFEQQLTVQNDQEKMFFCYPDLNCTSDLWVMHKIPTPTNWGCFGPQGKGVSESGNRHSVHRTWHTTGIFKLYKLQGQLILESEVSPNSSGVSIPQLPSDMYLYTLNIKGENSLKQGILVIE